MLRGGEFTFLHNTSSRDTSGLAPGRFPIQILFCVIIRTLHSMGQRFCTSYFFY